MRLYDIGNRARMGFWCIAPDEATAKQIALKAKHAKSLEALRARDVTDAYLTDVHQAPESRASLEALLTGTKTGRAFKRGTSYNAAEHIRDILEGKPISRNPWLWHLTEIAL